ncbi:MAG TPA: hypothetical protein PKN93_18235, partial [Leptospiraceae bacterium]|nr:hypothetical protein [Leptospiraceae bacterium]HNN76595.1 hypothetical protein [Leptospiraceae bacterium]
MRRVIILIAFAALAAPSALFAQLYTPPGYGAGQSVQGMGFGLDLGYETVDDDIYVTVAPLLELPFFFDIKLGVQIPLEVLAYDRDPKSGKKTGSLRTGTFDDTSDYIKVIKYARRGTHLYYNPGDAFNWSFFYGQMTDGYIGHRTIVHRYVNNYDPTVFKAGLMADINNDWGGLEAFMSDVYRKEAVAGRAYIRPVGIVTGVHDIFWASSGFRPSQVALSVADNRDPHVNGGVFFQEEADKKMLEPGRGGRLQQHLYPTMRDSVDQGGTTGANTTSANNPSNPNRPIQFEKVTDPITGETQVRAVPADNPATNPANNPATNPANNPATNPANNPATNPVAPADSGKSESSKGSKWSPSFWNRWALGYTIARDKNAPLTLEKDGSANLVVDPDDKRPRAATDQTLTIVGMDTEFRLSPFTFLEVTPYADLNKFKDIDKSKGLHGGVNFEFRIMETLKLYIRPEYREMSSNYIPTYFDQYYSLERTALQPRGVSDFSGLSSASNQTKLAYLKSLPVGGTKVRGYYGQVMMDWLQTLVVELNYEDYVGPDNS